MNADDAREDLFTHLAGGCEEDHPSFAAALDAYVHALAERQRTWAAERCRTDARADGFSKQLLDAQADLIDPVRMEGGTP